MLNMVECQKTFESLSIRSCVRSVSLYLHSCVRIEYPDPAVQPWALISRLFISEVRYLRNETVQVVKATDARAFSAKSTTMQIRIDAGITKRLALALKPG